MEPTKLATEPPGPSSDAAQHHHVPSNPVYLINSHHHHLVHDEHINNHHHLLPKAIRNNKSRTLAPEEESSRADIDDAALFPYLVRRDSVIILRSDMHPLFTTSPMAMYDGARGTMIPNYGKPNHPLDEYRGERIQDGPGHKVKGNNNDMMMLISWTRPDDKILVQGIHRQYFLVEGGSNLIATNTSCSSTTMADDDPLKAYAYELIKYAGGARLAPEVGWVDDGGADLLKVETILDTWNAPPVALLERSGLDLPVMTWVDPSGRTYASIRQANGALGAKHLTPLVERLAAGAECFVQVYSPAGLPNARGGYEDTLEDLAEPNRVFFENGWLNLVGGCCGATPSYIKAIRQVAKNCKPRKLPDVGRPKMWWSGLEDVKVEDVHNHLVLPFLNVGDRCNIAKSIHFKELMMAGDYSAAMDMAKQQVEDGAHVININVDDGLLDGLAAMQKFVKITVTEPANAKVPFMLDASKFEIVLAGLKWCQDKCIVNSISHKVGVKDFVEQATLLKKHGAAVVVVVALDEQGPAATEDDKLRICKRSYDILVNQVKFPPEDIIFDPSVLTIGAGLEEHANYGIDFVKATKRIKEKCPYVKISGSISNLSFGFRRVTKIRESIHSVFLHHAILESGMDAGIVNAKEMLALSEVEPELLSAAEDLIFTKTADATEPMLGLTKREKEAMEARVKGGATEVKQSSRRDLEVKRRLEHASVNGVFEFVEKDTEEAQKTMDRPLEVIVLCQCETTVEKAKETIVDVNGLSGSITPLLGEPVVVAKELSKAALKQPHLIGKATKSKLHTTDVKIAQNYSTFDHPVIHLLDASNSVSVVSSVLGDSQEEYVEDIMEEHEEMRQDYYAGLEDRYSLTFQQAKQQKFVVDFGKLPSAPTSKTLGITVIDNVEIADVVHCMDWHQSTGFLYDPSDLSYFQADLPSDEQSHWQPNLPFDEQSHWAVATILESSSSQSLEVADKSPSPPNSGTATTNSTPTSVSNISSSGERGTASEYQRESLSAQAQQLSVPEGGVWPGLSPQHFDVPQPPPSPSVTQLHARYNPANYPCAIKILVSNNVAGSIIGRSGQTISELQAQSATRIKLSQSGDYYPGTQDRVCLIQGETENVKTALRLLLERLYMLQEHQHSQHMAFQLQRQKGAFAPTFDFVVRLLVPSSSCGMIIGKQGSNIKLLEEGTGVSSVRLSPKESVDAAFPANALMAATTERIVTVTGQGVDGCFRCLGLIVEALAAHPEICRYTNMTTSYSRLPDNFLPIQNQAVLPATTPRRLLSNKQHLWESANVVVGSPGLPRRINSSPNLPLAIHDRQPIAPPSAQGPEAAAPLGQYPPHAATIHTQVIRPTYPFAPQGIPQARDLHQSTSVPNLLAVHLDNSMQITSLPPAVSHPPHPDFSNSFIQQAPTMIAPGCFTAQVCIPDSMIGSILGRGGRTLTELELHSGTRIRCSQRGEYMPGTRLRIVSIRGPTSHSVWQAQYIMGQRMVLPPTASYTTRLEGITEPAHSPSELELNLAHSVPEPDHGQGDDHNTGSREPCINTEESNY